MQFIIKKKRKKRLLLLLHILYIKEFWKKYYSFHKNINRQNHFQLKRFMSSILNNYFKIHSNRKVLNCYTIPQFYCIFE